LGDGRRRPNQRCEQARTKPADEHSVLPPPLVCVARYAQKPADEGRLGLACMRYIAAELCGVRIAKYC
jgi:hypothetical protein